MYYGKLKLSGAAKTAKLLGSINSPRVQPRPALCGTCPLPDGSWPSLAINQSFAENYLIPFENQWNYNPSPDRTYLREAGVIVGMEHSCDGYTETCSYTNHQRGFVCTGMGPIGTYCGYVHPDDNSARTGYRFARATIQYWDPANREVSVGNMALAVGVSNVTTAWSYDVESSSFGGRNGYVRHLGSDEMRDGGAVTSLLKTPGVVAQGILGLRISRFTL